MIGWETIKRNPWRWLCGLIRSALGKPLCWVGLHDWGPLWGRNEKSNAWEFSGWTCMYCFRSDNRQSGVTRCARCDNDFIWIRDQLFDGMTRCDNCGNTWKPCDS